MKKLVMIALVMGIMATLGVGIASANTLLQGTSLPVEDPTGGAVNTALSEPDDTIAQVTALVDELLGSQGQSEPDDTIVAVTAMVNELLANQGQSEPDDTIVAVTAMLEELLGQ